MLIGEDREEKSRRRCSASQEALGDAKQYKEQTHSTEPPSGIKRTLILDGLFDQIMYRLELMERRDEEPAVVFLIGVDFPYARRRSAFVGALEEVVFPVGR